MRLTLSNKLFAGFAILSLLTIFLGLTTLVIVEEMAKSQRNTGLLQEFELRIDALEAATAAQSNASFISAQSHETFLANLDRTKELAKTILTSNDCPAGPDTNHAVEADSCQSVMMEAIASYPATASNYYDKTIFTLRLINKNHYIYRKMLEATDHLPDNENKLLATKIINQLEILKHSFEESNDFETIKEMKGKFHQLEDLKAGSDFVKFTEMFVNNSEQVYLNRLGISKLKEGLAEQTGRFKKTSQNTYKNIIAESHDDQILIRTVIILLSLASVAMTLLFWLLTYRRLTRFLTNQKNAINSIKSGNYDYEIVKDSPDELGELCAFTKSLAVNLKEEIDEREYSQQEKKNLQSQLMQAQRLESIGILTGGIAHDFNNILTGITGYTDLALARLEDTHPVKRYLEKISLSGQKACEMTRQLLLFSRKQELNKQVINLNTTTEKLLKMLEWVIGDDIVIELKTTPDLPNVMADPAQIEQILMNMAVNAKDAMPDGGKLTIKTSITHLDESAISHLQGVDPGDFVQISITDNGAGMTAEVKEKIFDPFFTTKATHLGSGLGLATVFGVIKQHNGYVTVDSAVDQGTTFNFFLPVISADLPVDATQKPVEPTIAKGQETILLVDDNDTARDFVCETLEYCGYKLLTANSGNEADKIMHQTDYVIDLLLTDVVMPGMNGIELAEIAKGIYPKIKILFMSGYTDLPQAELKGKMPANGEILQKPMSIDTLSRKVRKALDR